jgi:uncharacterized membrane protein (UPF0127 family)
MSGADRRDGHRPETGRHIVALVAVMLLSIACRAEPTPASASASASARTSASTSDRTTVHLGGDPWTVLLAGPDGMRGLPDFDGADGMLFDFREAVDPSAVVFVMDGVAFPLDIAWFGVDGEPVGMTTMAVCPAKPCPTYAADAPYRWAIEAPVGAFAGLDPDARLGVP